MLIFSSPALSDAEPVEQTGQIGLPLSTFLHQHWMPLVEARMTPGPDGNDTLLLYGFVATESDKLEAESQALDFLDDPTIEVNNLIKVSPELEEVNSSRNGNWLVSSDATTSDPSATDEPAGESGSSGAESAGDSLDGITDSQARQPLDSVDDDE